MTESRDVIVTMCRDVSLPTVVKTYPVSGQQGVLINEKVRVWFSKPMDENNTIVTVYNDGPSPGTATNRTWEEGGTLLTLCLNPLMSCLMENDRHYTVIISGGSKDKWGLYLDGNYDGIQNGPGVDDYVFSFHTEIIDIDPPVAVLDHWPPVPTFIAPFQLIFSGVNSTDNKGIEWWDITVENGMGPPQDFGSKVIANATTPPIWFNVTGTFCAHLNVSDGPNMNYTISCVDITTVDIVDPFADAGPDMIIAPGQMVFFDGSGSYDDITPTWDLNYTWMFFDGVDGKIKYGINPTHPDFVTVGTWPVTLTVTDKANNFDTDEMNVTVEFDPAPNADAGPSFNICAGEIVTLNASGTTDNNPLADLLFEWSFSDGARPVNLLGIVVVHQFNVSGDFLIKLNVTDVSGNWDVATTW
ncbi:MAG: Ig-like domain-containing protein, partial [Thermoplasmata archaeon]|nr:Ig-like domain-containing protein [Thermoplasmata archaeon]